MGALLSTGNPEEFTGIAQISFPIPLAAVLDSAHVKIVDLAPSPECENSEHPGTASTKNPEAKPGYLCVYVTEFWDGTALLENGEGFAEAITKAGRKSGVLGEEAQVGASTAGAMLTLAAESSTSRAALTGFGTFAVTAP
jgi:hypothetical protein